MRLTSFRLFSLSFSLLISACAPTIQVSTPEPVKIDVNMRVDVHTKDDREKPAKTANETSLVASRRFARMGEIQDLKNAAFIGENNKGYLEIRQKPEGKIPSGEPYDVYAQRLVREENNDRRSIYLLAAEKEGVPMEVVEQENSKRWHESAFPKEWLQKEDGTWFQK
ncbi:MAG: DUF1318 domain-containing protein [Verrucomicrobiota bacterium]